MTYDNLLVILFTCVVAKRLNTDGEEDVGFFFDIQTWEHLGTLKVYVFFEWPLMYEKGCAEGERVAYSIVNFYFQFFIQITKICRSFELFLTMKIYSEVNEKKL